MVKMTQEQAEKLLLDKQNILNFLKMNSTKLFGSSEKIEVLEIKRSKNLNPTSFNLLYKLNIGQEIVSIRASTSTKFDNDYNFNVLQFLRSNGFDKGDVLVAVTGDIFKNQLKEPMDILIVKVKLVAQGLRKIHRFQKVPFHLWPHDWSFDRNLIGQYYPELANEVQDIRQDIIKGLENSKTCLCHGDYQPDNLIFNNDKLTIIDWGSTTLSQKEQDLASFIIKLEVMLPEFGNEENFPILKGIFLKEYGEYDKQLFNQFYILYGLRILNSFAEFPDYEHARQRMDKIYNILNKRLHET